MKRSTFQNSDTGRRTQDLRKTQKQPNRPVPPVCTNTAVVRFLFSFLPPPCHPVYDASFVCATGRRAREGGGSRNRTASRSLSRTRGTRHSSTTFRVFFVFLRSNYHEAVGELEDGGLLARLPRSGHAGRRRGAYVFLGRWFG